MENEKLLNDIEIALSMAVDKETREKVMHIIISNLRNYEITKMETGVAVRDEVLNEDILKKYVACMAIDGKSKRTIKQYVWTLQKFEKVVGKTYTAVTTDDIRYFLGCLKMNGSKNSYISGQRACISAFYMWLEDEEIIEKSPCRKVKKIKVEKEIRLPFSAVEIDKLRSGCKRKIDRAIVELLLSSGVRCEELCNLKLMDVDLAKRIVNVKDGKGGKDRVTYMSDVAAEHIGKYLASRKVVGPYLFMPVRSKYDHYSIRGIEGIVSRAGDRAEVEDVHPHRFRRTFATDLYKRGMDIASISKLMGHANIEVTKQYIYIADEQLHGEYRRFTA